MDYVRYRPDVEEIDPDEGETFDKIISVMAGGGRITRERYGHAVRTSHAKAHGLLRGELRVMDGLAEPLRQGLFAEAHSYPDHRAPLPRARRAARRPQGLDPARHGAQGIRRAGAEAPGPRG